MEFKYGSAKGAFSSRQLYELTQWSSVGQRPWLWCVCDLLKFNKERCYGLGITSTLLNKINDYPNYRLFLAPQVNISSGAKSPVARR